MSFDRIVSDPYIMSGQACVHGTRIAVSVILDNLAAGASLEDITRDYPSLERADVLAAMAYAARLARDLVVDTDDQAA